MKLTSDAVGFISVYRDLPPALQEKFNLSLLRHAKDYCDKHKVTSGEPDIDELVTKAFKSMDQSSTPRK